MKRILRIVGIIVAVVVVLLLVVAGYIFFQSNAKINNVYEVNPITLELPDDEESLVEGERIFRSRGCGDCHTADGGGDPAFIDDPALGSFGATNLTRGAGGYDYTAEDYIRAIQHGVGRDGTALFIMPSQDWQKMPEAELAPLVAYLMQLDPVDREKPDSSYGFIGRALVAFGQIPFAAEVIAHENAGLLDIEAAPTVEYGAYLAVTCQGCHGENYSGQEIPGERGVFSENITPHADGIGDWSLDDFMTALRTGERPDGSQINPDQMPWPSLLFSTDVELEAIYLYLQTVDPVAAN